MPLFKVGSTPTMSLTSKGEGQEKYIDYVHSLKSPCPNELTINLSHDKKVEEFRMILANLDSSHLRKNYFCNKTNCLNLFTVMFMIQTKVMGPVLVNNWGRLIYQRFLKVVVG